MQELENHNHNHNKNNTKEKKEKDRKIKHKSAMKHFATIAITLLFLFHSTTTTSAQPASSPSPPGPTNITAVLEKAGQFSTFIRLLKTTQVSDQINNQLNNSNTGLTIFAPTDNAFSSLPAGTLNSLTDQQKVALIQFHILPSLVSMSQFQTVSNPLRTQAGNANNGQYPLNITAIGSQVNISTGIVNTTISNSLFSDGQLAVYQVDQVLLPLDIFRPSVAPAPAPSSPEKKKPSTSEGPSSSTTPADSTDTSDAIGLGYWRGNDGLFVGLMLSIWWSL
ncbi:fasciclin-like arabinogalactan protein 11 [Typha angustifolia]|uniref:fasciclin-like arabinogalactan protein 11 n=1 Tax=Typha angustifolia TaxID=59011 RepID=UPI003C2D8441